jgi:hypothetical protein
MSLIESFRSLLAWLRRIAMQTHARFTRAIVELGERAKRRPTYGKLFVPSRRTVASLLGVVAVHQELIADSEAIKFDVQYLEADIAAAQSNSEIVPPMQDLVTVAGDTAYLKGSFEDHSVELSIKLRTIYSSWDVS